MLLSQSHSLQLKLPPDQAWMQVWSEWTWFLNCTNQFLHNQRLIQILLPPMPRHTCDALKVSGNDLNKMHWSSSPSQIYEWCKSGDSPHQTKTHSNVSLFFPPRWNCWSSHSPTLNSNLWHTISLIQESASHVARGVRPFSHHVMTSQLTPQRSRLAQKSHCRGPRNSTETIYGGKNYDHAVSHVE